MRRYNEVMRTRLVVLGTVLIAIAVAMAVFSVRMYPFQPATADQFWAAALRMPDRSFLGLWEFDSVQDGYVYYHLSQYHGWAMYRVPLSEVEAAFPQVLLELRGDNGSVQRGDWVMPAFGDWQRESGGQGDATSLILALDEGLEQLILSRASDPVGHAFWMGQKDGYFNLLYGSAKRYWWAIAFESVFFAGLALVLLWPWLRRQGVWAWASHLAMLPVLWFMPVHCGYGTWAFTSSGEGTAILYPRLAMRTYQALEGVLRAVNDWLPDDFPCEVVMSNALAPLNQPATPPVANTYFGLPTLGSVYLLGGAAFIAIVIVGWTWRGVCSLWRRRRRRRLIEAMQALAEGTPALTDT